MQINEGGSGGTSRSSEKTFLYASYRYEGGVRVRYVFYEQYGVRHMYKESIPLPKPTNTRKGSIVNNRKKKNKIKKNAHPSNIAKKPKAPKAVSKPSFTMAKPAPPTKHSFDAQKPVKKEVLIPDSPKPPGPKPNFLMKHRVPVTKLEYVYGIRDLQVRHAQYESKSIYVSTPIPVEGNVMSVSLHSIEEHPLFDSISGAATDRQTSVEYYIAPIGVNPIPTPEDWMPILPEDQLTIKCELLIFETARTASLRFPALIGSNPSPVLYKNGLAMDSSDWSFADGGYKIQLFVDKEPTSIYTIDYTPNAEFYNPWLLNIKDKVGSPTKYTQSFPDGTNHNKTITLDKYPYVNYEVINTTADYDSNLNTYVPVKVTLKDASIAGGNKTFYSQVLPYDGTTQTVFTKNITDYKTGVHPGLKPYSIDPASSYKGFEYYQEGNKLFFSETFNKADIYANEQESHGNATIVVDYEYLASQFRVKIILRRNSLDESTLTPVVQEYALKFKIMK